MPKEDEPGFDPFEEPDPLREQYPAHEPVSVGALLPVDKLAPPAGSTEPPAIDVRCGVCHKTFRSRAGWFFGQWRHSLLCLDCADGNSLPPGFVAECDRPRVAQMRCLGCGISRGVEPTLRHNLWAYELDCTVCGQHMVSYHRLRRRCSECQEHFYVSEKRPQRTCHKCSTTKSPY